MFTPRYLKLLTLSRGPTDHKRSVGQQVSLSEDHNQLFSFAHIQRETVSWHHDVSLSTSSKYVVSSLLEMRPRTTVSSANLIIAAVNVCEGGVEYVRDGIISRSIGTIGN